MSLTIISHPAISVPFLLSLAFVLIFYFFPALSGCCISVGFYLLLCECISMMLSGKQLNLSW